MDFAKRRLQLGESLYYKTLECILLGEKHRAGSCKDRKANISVSTYEPRREKTGLRGFRSGPTQTGLYKLRKELEA